MEIHKSHASASSGARNSTDQIPQPAETPITQRSTLDLVLWSDEPGGVLEPAQEERTRQRQERCHRSECSGEGHARGHPHEFPKWCSYCVRARAADDPHHRHTHKEQEFPIIMADYCFMRDAPGKELFTILDMLDIALNMMAAIIVEDKELVTYVVSAVVEHLRA